jgi:hypothetical protein
MLGQRCAPLLKAEHEVIGGVGARCWVVEGDGPGTGPGRPGGLAAGGRLDRGRVGEVVAAGGAQGGRELGAHPLDHGKDGLCLAADGDVAAQGVDVDEERGRGVRVLAGGDVELAEVVGSSIRWTMLVNTLTGSLLA